MIRRALLLALALALVAVPAAVAAQPRASYTDVEDELMCVSCNVPLNIAESPQAAAEKRELRTLVAQGLTKRQIKDRLVAEYGRDVLADPPASGFGVATWLVPIGIALALIALLAVLLPRWRRRPPAPADTAGPTLSGADARRLEEDLARYDV